MKKKKVSNSTLLLLGLYADLNESLLEIQNQLPPPTQQGLLQDIIGLFKSLALDIGI